MFYFIFLYKKANVMLEYTTFFLSEVYRMTLLAPVRNFKIKLIDPL